MIVNDTFNENIALDTIAIEIWHWRSKYEIWHWTCIVKWHSAHLYIYMLFLSFKTKKMLCTWSEGRLPTETIISYDVASCLVTNYCQFLLTLIWSGVYLLNLPMWEASLQFLTRTEIKHMVFLLVCCLRFETYREMTLLYG